MRTWRTTLLASAAALALSTGMGFAQGMTPEHGTGAAGAAQEQHGGAAQPHAAQSPAQQAPGAANKSMGKADRAAQGTQQPGGAMEQGKQQATQPGTNRNAEQSRSGTPQNAQNKDNEPNKNQAQQGPKTEPNRGTAQEQQRSNERNAASQQQRGSNSAAERLEHNGRLQGNASGVNVQLNDQQRKEIRTTVIEKGGAPRVGHIDFDVTVGTVVPRERIHVVPVPETLVQIEPGWRGFMYFVYEDEIIVVNPRDYKIVAVLPV